MSEHETCPNSFFWGELEGQYMQLGMHKCVYDCMYTFICLFSIHFLRLGSPNGLRPPLCRSFETTLRHTTLSRTPLDEWSVRRSDPN